MNKNLTRQKLIMVEAYLDAVKAESPNTKITVKTKNNSVSCRLKDAIIYQDSYGDLVIDAENNR